MINLIGKPFKDGGRGPDLYDCWGLTMVVLQNFGYCLPDYPVCAFDCARVNEEIEQQKHNWQEIKEPVAGCVVTMRMGLSPVVNHIGVCIGEGKFIHAREKTGVCIERLENPVFKSLISGFYLPPEAYRI